MEECCSPALAGQLLEFTTPPDLNAIDKCRFEGKASSFQPATTFFSSHLSDGRPLAVDKGAKGG